MLVGAIGVVTSRNPVHAALSLVLTLFGVAVLFVEQQADFLAAVQVIVYAGAIVVLFLFVIMFLGVDRLENIEAEPLRGQRPLAFAARRAIALGGIIALFVNAHWVTGAHSVAGSTTGGGHTNVYLLGKSVFTTYLFAFEATAALLVIAVVGRGGAGPPAAGRACSTSPRTTTEPGGTEVGGTADADADARGRRRGGRPLGRGPPRWSPPAVRPSTGRGPDEHRGRLVPGAGRRALRHRGHRPAGAAQRAGHVHVHRADAERRQPHLRHLLARCCTTSAARPLVFFVLVVAAAEVVVGLGIVVAIFRRRANTTADDLHSLKG